MARRHSKGGPNSPYSVNLLGQLQLISGEATQRERGESRSTLEQRESRLVKET